MQPGPVSHSVILLWSAFIISIIIIIIITIVIIIIIIIIIIVINWRIVKDWKNPCLAIFRQRCLQCYDSIFGQTIFRASDWTASYKQIRRI